MLHRYATKPTCYATNKMANGYCGAWPVANHPARGHKTRYAKQY